MYRHVLVPLDNTDLAPDPVGRAVELARTLGARITFFHARRDGSDEWVRELLVKAESAANAQGVPCASLVRPGDEPCQGIIAASRETGCDLIYMASRACGGEIGTPGGSTTLGVLAGAAVPVLVDATKNPVGSTPAIDIIRDEHRSLAAVLHAWLHLVGKADADSRRPDTELMHAMLHYLRDFPLAFHHPKEEKYLFAALRQRTSHFDAELRELERQHEHDHQLIDELAAAVERLACGELPIADLKALVGSYALFVWEHMGREEGLIIPAAQRHLTIADWEAVNAAFEKSRDPGFEDDTAAEYRALFARILELAGSPSTAIPDNHPPGGA